MICLECHKIVDELEDKFSVEQMQAWKTDHEMKINSLFNFPQICPTDGIHLRMFYPNMEKPGFDRAAQAFFKVF